MTKLSADPGDLLCPVREGLRGIDDNGFTRARPDAEVVGGIPGIIVLAFAEALVEGCAFGGVA
jgi:hypothetical protein